MKRVLVGMCVAMSVFAAQAEEAAESKTSKTGAIGVFGGVTAGGDLEDEGSAVYGGQMTFVIDDTFFVELSVTSVGDEYDEDGIHGEIDVQSLGVSLGARSKVAARCALYGLIGPDYNFTDSDISVDQTLYPGVFATFESDDEFGFHAAVGSTYDITDSLQFFAEYRYTFLEIDVESTVGRYDGAVPSIGFRGEGDLDFGAIKAGLNVFF